MIVLRPNGGEDDGSDDVSTPSLLNRADYEYLFTEPAQSHSFTPGTRATYEFEARSDGRKIAFNIRQGCTDKWEQWERQELEELLLGLSGMQSRVSKWVDAHDGIERTVAYPCPWDRICVYKFSRMNYNL